MILAFDIGNQHINFGVFDRDVLRASWRISTRVEGTPDEYAVLLNTLLRRSDSAYKFAGGVLASSVPPMIPTFVELCQAQFGWTPLVVGAGVKTGIHIRVDYPQSVGADRVVDAAAVKHLYGGPACVVDFGTATTFDAVSAEGDYLGGAIAPGIDISAEALFTRTAQLPRVELQRPPSVIGRNTVHAMQSGLIFGYTSLVEGMIQRFRAELGPTMKVIATGGLAETIAQETNAIQIIAPWLTLDGLRVIWEMNQKK